MEPKATVSGAAALATALLLGCSSSSDGSGAAKQNANLGGSGGGATSGVGGGGGTEYPKAVDVTDPADCHYEGYGGANGWDCAAVTIQLSEPVALADLEVSLTTDLGDTFTSACVGDSFDCDVGTEPFLAADADPATRLVITTINGAVYNPTSLSVSLVRAGTTIASAELGPVDYACEAITNDDWCWESEALSLQVTE